MLGDGKRYTQAPHVDNTCKGLHRLQLLTHMVRTARHHAVEGGAQHTILNPLAGSGLCLAGLFKVRLHLHPAHVADTALFMYVLHASVCILGLAQGSTR